MSVKCRKVSDGVFTLEEVTITGADKGDFEEICKLLNKGVPEARIQSHETFVNTTHCTDPYVEIRINRLRGLVAQAKNIIVTGGIRQTALHVLDNADNVRREILALPYTRKGIGLTARNREPNRLYREAVAILKREGTGTKAKQVLEELHANKVVRTHKKKPGLHWTDDKKRTQCTSLKQFEKRLSHYRTLLR